MVQGQNMRECDNLRTQIEVLIKKDLNDN